MDTADARPNTGLVKPSPILLGLWVVLSFATIAMVAEPLQAKEGQYGIDPKRNVEKFQAVPEAEKKKIVLDFTKLLNSSMTIMQEHRFLGIKTWQNPFDVWVTQEIISETKPEVIVETGTFRGGSSLMWAMYLDQVSPGGRVITIDVQDKRRPQAKEHPLAERIDFLLGSSTAPEIVAEVKKRVAGKRVLFILDSLHTKDHVADELAAYAELVPAGGYVIVQDTAVGAGDAVRELYVRRAREYFHARR